MASVNPLNSPIIFFDGICNFCNSSIQFLIKIDKHHKLKYSSLQSNFARQNLSEKYLIENLNKGKNKSIVLLNQDVIFEKSDAILQILKIVAGGWVFLYYLGLILPKFIRDWAYDLVAKNRYRIFGKKNECMIPTPSQQKLFLD